MILVAAFSTPVASQSGFDLLIDSSLDFFVKTTTDATGTSDTEIPGLLSVQNPPDFNQGTFNGTSADRNGNSGTLGIGYLNGSNPSSTDLGKDLVGYWRMDSSVSGTDGTVFDYSGNENNGFTKGGLTTGSAGIMSTDTFEFDGTDDYVSIPSSINGELSGGISFSAWIKPETTDGSMVIGMIEESNFESYKLFRLRTDFDNWKILDDTGTAYGVNFNNEPPVGKWSHIVGVYDDKAGQMILYLNGTEDATADTGSFTYEQLDKPANIGRDPRNQDHITGKIDEVRIYNRALNQTEVEKLYFNGINDKFKGNYTKTVDTSTEQNWSKIQVDATVPSQTSLDLNFRAKDSSGTTLETESFTVEDTEKNYTLNVQDSEDAEIVFNGTSSDVTKTWTVKDFTVYSKTGSTGEKVNWNRWG